MFFNFGKKEQMKKDCAELERWTGKPVNPHCCQCGKPVVSLREYEWGSEGYCAKHLHHMRG